jgi:hypothetical protein
MRSLAIISIIDVFEVMLSDAVVLEAAAVLAVIGSTLALHLHVKPYEHNYQNALETALSTSSILFINLLLLVHDCKQTSDGDGSCTHATSTALLVSAVVVLVSPCLFCLAWLCVSGGRLNVSRARVIELMLETVRSRRSLGPSSRGTPSAQIDEPLGEALPDGAVTETERAMA